MIAREYRLKQYCDGDVTKIENYYKAKRDKKNVWVCHHRNEIELNMTREELMDQGLYFKRPPEELIFLTNSEHSKLHATGEAHPNYRGLDRQSIIDSYIRKENSARAIAAEFGITTSTIYRILDNEGISARHHSNMRRMNGRCRENHPMFVWVCPLILYKLRVIDGMSKKQIAKELGISKPTIKLRLRDCKIS